MIRILFLVYLTVCAEEAASGEERVTVLWNRLKNYQNFTGISDEKIENIWRTRNDAKSANVPMAKVHTTGKLSVGNPAVFGGISFNEGMNYNNGVFLILDPGYYRIDVNLRMGYRNLYYSVFYSTSYLSI